MSRKDFLGIEKSAPDQRGISTVKAINYDARYYGNDKDYINNVIGRNGYDKGGAFTPGGNGFPIASTCIDIVARDPDDYGDIGFSIGYYAYPGTVIARSAGQAVGSVVGTIMGYTVSAAFASSGAGNFVLALTGSGIPPTTLFNHLTVGNDNATVTLLASSAASNDEADGSNYPSPGRVWVWNNGAGPEAGIAFTNHGTYHICAF